MYRIISPDLLSCGWSSLVAVVDVPDYLTWPFELWPELSCRCSWCTGLSHLTFELWPELSCRCSWCTGLSHLTFLQLNMWFLLTCIGIEHEMHLLQLLCYRNISPVITVCGWLGSKHQLTNLQKHPSLVLFAIVCMKKSRIHNYCHFP